MVEMTESEDGKCVGLVGHASGGRRMCRWVRGEESEEEVMGSGAAEGYRGTQGLWQREDGCVQVRSAVRWW